MKLEDLEQVEALRNDLHYADDVLAAFEALTSETVRCIAKADGWSAKGTRSSSVEVLPIPRSVAISAAQRERSKIIDKLAQLGVTVE